MSQNVFHSYISYCIIANDGGGICECMLTRKMHLYIYIYLYSFQKGYLKKLEQLFNIFLETTDWQTKDVVGKDRTGMIKGIEHKVRFFTWT